MESAALSLKNRIVLRVESAVNFSKFSPMCYFSRAFSESWKIAFLGRRLVSEQRGQKFGWPAALGTERSRELRTRVLRPPPRLVRYSSCPGVFRAASVRGQEGRRDRAAAPRDRPGTCTPSGGPRLQLTVLERLRHVGCCSAQQWPNGPESLPPGGGGR